MGPEKGRIRVAKGERAVNEEALGSRQSARETGKLGKTGKNRKG